MPIDPIELAQARLDAHEATVPGSRDLHCSLRDRIDLDAILMPPFEPLPVAAYKILLHAGRHFEMPVHNAPGIPGRCHANVAERFVTGEVDGVASGFCLDEGVWRLHTWGLCDGSLVETTTQRAGYFGVELTDPGAALFAFCELGDTLSHLSMAPRYVTAASTLRDLLRRDRSSERSVWDFLERAGLFVTT